MLETITLIRGATVWIARSDLPQVQELFGTADLPTPFSSTGPHAVPEAVVVARIRALNPAATVTVQHERLGAVSLDAGSFSRIHVEALDHRRRMNTPWNQAAPRPRQSARIAFLEAQEKDTLPRRAPNCECGAPWNPKIKGYNCAR